MGGETARGGGASVWDSISARTGLSRPSVWQTASAHGGPASSSVWHGASVHTGGGGSGGGDGAGTTSSVWISWSVRAGASGTGVRAGAPERRGEEEGEEAVGVMEAGHSEDASSEEERQRWGMERMGSFVWQRSGEEGNDRWKPSPRDRPLASFMAACAPHHSQQARTPHRRAHSTPCQHPPRGSGVSSRRDRPVSLPLLVSSFSSLSPPPSRIRPRIQPKPRPRRELCAGARPPPSGPIVGKKQGRGRGGGRRQVVLVS